MIRLKNLIPRSMFSIHFNSSKLTTTGLVCARKSAALDEPNATLLLRFVDTLISTQFATLDNPAFYACKPSHNSLSETQFVRSSNNCKTSFSMNFKNVCQRDKNGKKCFCHLKCKWNVKAKCPKADCQESSPHDSV